MKSYSYERNGNEKNGIGRGCKETRIINEQKTALNEGGKLTVQNINIWLFTAVFSVFIICGKKVKNIFIFSFLSLTLTVEK